MHPPRACHEPRGGGRRQQQVELERPLGPAPPNAQTAASGSVDEAGKTTLLGYPAMNVGSYPAVVPDCARKARVTSALWK
ncbi:hypothetical protein [Planctomyces sp. SH-PL62]|uniref:hypothetical protein n=1 Tax=Planctomyces sp. SH-PL62 TaxID=1636152 RepID=UPI0012E95354|nr:hypothetical protein [Planctomyces sp. SH-PL62]